MYKFSLVKDFSSSTHSYLECTAKHKIISSYPRKKILPNKRTSRNVFKVSYFQCFPTITFGTPSGRIVTPRETDKKIPKIVAYLSYSAGCKQFDRTEIQKVASLGPTVQFLTIKYWPKYYLLDSLTSSDVFCYSVH